MNKIWIRSWSWLIFLPKDAKASHNELPLSHEEQHTWIVGVVEFDALGQKAILYK